MTGMWKKTERFARTLPNVRYVTTLVIWFVTGLLLGVMMGREGPSVRYKLSSTSLSATPQLDSTLYRQGISHNVFHYKLVKQAMLAFVRKHNTVAIVGVEGGSDLQHFAMQGYKVYAFEPMRQYFDHFKNISKMPWFSPYASNVHFHKVAASDVGGKQITVKYHTADVHTEEKVNTARLDDFITEPLDLISADIQGNELNVVLGASKLMTASGKKGVRSLWVEIHACRPKAKKLLHLLHHSGYKLFDMVPHGGRKDHQDFRGLQDFDDAAEFGWNSRPSSIDEYIEWFCSLRKTHHWVQADVLAVRGDLVDATLMFKLSTLSHRILRTFVEK